MEDKHLIIGLGNPGKGYEKTRHNVGWMFLDYLKNLPDAEFEEWKEKKKLNAFVAEGTMEVTKSESHKVGKSNFQKIILAKPTTFMNNSGLAVQKIVTRYALPVTRYADDLIVVHDDMDIPFGEFKIQTNRGTAGHHGVESVVEHLGTKNFTRIRIGIAPATRTKAGDHVLKKFSSTELKNLQEVFSAIANQFLS